MEDILNYVRQLQKIDTKNILPMTDTSDLKNITRQDIVENHTELIRGYVKVKAIFKNE